jgi:hypothetical protein
MIMGALLVLAALVATLVPDVTLSSADRSPQDNPRRR